MDAVRAVIRHQFCPQPLPALILVATLGEPRMALSPGRVQYTLSCWWKYSSVEATSLGSGWHLRADPWLFRVLPQVEWDGRGWWGRCPQPLPPVVWQARPRR